MKNCQSDIQNAKTPLTFIYLDDSEIENLMGQFNFPTKTSETQSLLMSNFKNLSKFTFA